MIYSFDMEKAILYGVDEAIILANFEYWLAKNKAERRHTHEDRTWTFNSVDGFAKLFPCWSAKQIRRVINSLVSQKVIIKGNFNRKGYDQTSWYALTDESALLLSCPNGQMDVPKRANAIAQMGRPIPNNKLQIENTDIDLLYPHVNLEAWDEFEDHRKTLKPALTDLARKKLLNKIASLPSAKQQACIDLSIENGWKGLFPEKQSTGERNGAYQKNNQQGNSATRHHDRLKRAYAEAVAEEMGGETVQQATGDLQPQMVVSH